jgi:hypothetical protein
MGHAHPFLGHKGLRPTGRLKIKFTNAKASGHDWKILDLQPKIIVASLQMLGYSLN